MLCTSMPIAILLSVFKQHVIRRYYVERHYTVPLSSMLNAVLLSVIILNVVAPNEQQWVMVMLTASVHFFREH
jgi:hypothetical protein